MNRSPLNKLGKSPVSEAKRRIQALIREITILRDGGCVLRHYPAAGACGGRKKDGTLILQAEHLVTRARNISYGDMRNIVCLCSYHHGFWKVRNGMLYWELIQEHIGPIRWKYIKAVEADRKSYTYTAYDWANVESALQQELRRMKMQYHQTIHYEP